MRAELGRRSSGWRRVRLGLGLAVLLLAAPQAHSARAEAASDYAAAARTRIIELLQGRAFAPEEGCENKAACARLLKRLDAGDFAVIAPFERSGRPDLPSYRAERKRCPGIDPASITVSHRRYVATRGFAAFRIELPGRGKHGEEVLVFRAEHYVLRGEGGRAHPDAAQAPLMPGTFVALSLRGCRLLSSARAEDGDWLARHNAIGDADHASELLRIGGSYFVLNLAPIAGPDQPKASWWYTLELWDLGPRLDADRRHQRHVYSFGYRPDGAPVGASRAGRLPPG